MATQETHDRPRRRGGRRRTALAMAALMAFGAACSQADSNDTGSMDEDAASFDSAESVEAATAGSSGGTSAQGAPMEPNASTADNGLGDAGELARAASGGEVALTPVNAVAGRQLARTARLELAVKDVEQAAAQIRGMVARTGGFIQSAEVRGGEDGWGVLTLRVPATGLDDAVEELAAIATEVRLQQIGTDDLTDQLTDTDARLANLRALETELRSLMSEIRARTSNASELLVVFQQVNEVRLQIERLDASRAGLVDRVALATITVDLRPDAIELIPVVEPEPTTVEAAWATTRDVFGNIGDAFIWAGVTVVPVASFFLLPLGLAGWAVSRRRGRTASPAT